MLDNFRTRQAPSPTGYLHLGTARQMLFTKLFALSNKGSWYLRIEDTDQNRLVEGSVQKMLLTLSELGLVADEGVNLFQGEKSKTFGCFQKGDYGPYIQSERLDIYHQHAQNLIDKGLAYWSFLSHEEKEELVEIKAATKRAINYYEANLEKYGEELMGLSIEEALGDDRKPALKYRIQRDQKIDCYDELLGKTEFDLNLEEDFNILKSDGFPTYHLAHLIDDYLMRTSLVVRAQEWYPSLPKHVVMFRDYWGEEPKYLHTPFILGETGNKKLSKRDGNVDMHQYLVDGYLPEAIINYLAFLGWNPGTEKELYLEPEDFLNLSRTERLEKLVYNISQEFEVEKLAKSPSRFNLSKLQWFNKEYLKMMRLTEFTLRAAQNKIRQNSSDLKLRQGDYVYLVDFKTQKMFCEINAEKPGVENNLHPVGGGREDGENYLENIQREVLEETGGKLKINPNKLIKLINYEVINGEFVDSSGDKYDGKNFNIYLYEVKEKELERFVEDVNGREKIYDWVNLAEVISGNEYLNYPLWKALCQQNKLPVFEMNNQIKLQYLAWLFDQTRITTLKELGEDSETVLDWKKPDLETIKWKKISIEESVNCLTEISTEAIASIYNSNLGVEIVETQQKLYDSVTNDLVESVGVFEKLVSLWEQAIKDWLKFNQKDTGSHLWPLRTALSGKKRSPSPFELLSVLPVEEVERRINEVVSS